MSQKRILVSVISELTTDQRVIKVCTTLQQMGFNVQVIARSFNNSLPLGTYSFKARRIRCYFNKGFLQYAEFNIKLFGALIFSKTDFLLANDLDVLLPNYLVSTFRKKKLFYDTHEYFTGVPELRNAPLKRKFWKSIENFIFPGLKEVYTVNGSVKALYANEYGNDIKVIRNVPVTDNEGLQMPVPAEWAGKKILLMQGAGINTGRGGIQLLEAMRLLNNEFLLVYIGGGTEWALIAEKRTEWGLQANVVMMNRVTPEQLKQYTKMAYIGFSLDSFKDVNYLYNLPNKIFDYMHAGIPVIATAIPEVKQIMNKYSIGICIDDNSAEKIAAAVKKISSDVDAYENYRNQCKLAAGEYCWEKESEILKSIYQPYLVNTEK